MSDCCECSTRWEIEETRWTVYGYGLSDGAQYLGPKLNIANPSTPPVGCAPGAWNFIGEKKNRIFYKRIEKLYDKIVKRELVEPPYSNGDCVNVTGGVLISNTLLSEDNQNYGLDKIATRVTNNYSAGSYWKYGTCNAIAIGWEEFKYRKEVYKKVYKKIYEANHTCGKGNCCASNSNVPNIFNREQEYENWVNKI